MSADFVDVTSIDPLSGSLRDYAAPSGADLVGRVSAFFAWQDQRRAAGLWPYSKASASAPRPRCEGRTDANLPIGGVNFASQDYLSLSSHPEVVGAAKVALDRFGVHSAGSSALFGNTTVSVALEAALSDFLGGKEVLLYPTGWGAGFGAVQGFVRPNDHVVMDILAHSCLQEGARAATRNIYFHGHINVESAERRLKQIRSKDKNNAILLVTESLFSMHSDTPNLSEMRAICDTYDAKLLVDVAHDFGCIGDQGLGHVGLQRMLDKVDIMIGSFSKTFASNGGFIAVNSRAAKEYLKYYSATQTFSNAMSPVQAAVVTKALEIVRSAEGQRRRRDLMANILYLRAELARSGMDVLGHPSAIVPVHVGAEGLARVATSKLAEIGVIANMVEYPAVPRGAARYRLQVMADHVSRDIDALVDCMVVAVREAGRTLLKSAAMAQPVESGPVLSHQAA